MKLRPEVRAFAELMERNLRENSHKGGWECCSLEYLCRRMIEEMFEMKSAGSAIERASEAADVANFAMMIASNSEGLMMPKEKHEA